MRFTQFKRNAKSGFTIVEMAIVVAVIALLVAIAVPAINKARHTAKEAEVDATLRTLNDAITRIRLKQEGNDGMNIQNLPPEFQSGNASVIVEYLLTKGYVQ
jgi:hypothetical protein